MDVYRTAFFKCTECNFKLSLLGAQNQYELEGFCPSCEGNLDYMSTREREEYVKEIKDEMKYM